MKGRRPKPIQLHKLAGTYRADRHGNATPQPAERLPPCPGHLDAAAKREYRRAGKILSACRVLTEADRAGLACYSQAWSRMIEAEEKLRETGLIVKSPAGFPCISPYLSIAVKAGEELRRWATELGLTPSARTKIKVEPATPYDPMQALLAEANQDKGRFFRPRPQAQQEAAG